jgi:hypothetical protein
MGVLFLVLKIFPAFGVALAALSFDFARNFKRKGSKAWIAFAGLWVLFLALSILWFVFRGDQNAELWFARFLEWGRS